MPDITMNVDDTLELDTIIEESTRSSNPVTNVDSSFEQYGIQTHTHILNPTKPGDYTIKVNGQELTIKVNDTSTIPDSGNLLARYDARNLSKSDGDSVDTWPDDTENGNDLTGGSPTFRDSGASNLGSVPSVRFDGVDDTLSVTFGSTIDAPFHVFYLGKYNTLNDFEGMWGEDVQDEWKSFTVNSGSWRYDGFREKVQIGSTDTNSHIWNHRILNDNPSLRLDGSDVGGGTISLTDLKGLTIGSYAGDNNYGEVEFTEILVYSVDEESAGKETDIESYLDRDTRLI